MEKGLNKRAENVEALKSKWHNQKNAHQDNKPSIDAKKRQSSCHKAALHESYVPKLGLILRDGKRYYIPYSRQPIIEFIPSEGLHLITSAFRVEIKGRGLDHLVDYLYDDTLEWIKEANQRVDDGSEAVFITSIEVRGKMFEL